MPDTFLKPVPVPLVQSFSCMLEYKQGLARFLTIDIYA